MSNVTNDEPVNPDPSRLAIPAARSPLAIYAHHPRQWEDFAYVYPVVSRRSGGLSIGVNLNIDKACNFDCIYCCVDRSVLPIREDVDLEQVQGELDRLLGWVRAGTIWQYPPFDTVPDRLRRVNDIAFSGDGEPTTYPGFEDACRMAVASKVAHHLDETKIVVISNATTFDRPMVQRALKILDRHEGEVWAKLDAGTEGYYALVDRTRFPLSKVLENIMLCGRVRPIVIQSLFMAVHGQPVPDAEFDAYLSRVVDLVEGGCQIKLVQLYTTARQTAEAYVSPLENKHLDRLKSRFRQRLPHLAVETYYGVG